MDDVPSTDSGKEHPSCTHSPLVQKKSWRNKALLTLLVAGIILFIWGVLVVPIIIYHLPEVCCIYLAINVYLSTYAAYVSFIMMWGVLLLLLILQDFGPPMNGMNNISVKRNTSEIQCRDDFILVLNGTRCNPRCDRFEQIPHHKRVLEDVLNSIGVGIYTFSFTVLIIVSIIRW